MKNISIFSDKYRVSFNSYLYKYFGIQQTETQPTGG